MSKWWRQLSQRDQRIIIVGAFVSVALLWWAFLIEPAQSGMTTAQQNRLQVSGQLAEMRGMAGQWKTGEQSASRKPRGDSSLLALLDQSARDRGLQSVIQRMEPVGEDSVRLWLNDVNFDLMALWLESLARDYGIEATELSFSRGEMSGVVTGRLTVREP